MGLFIQNVEDMIDGLKELEMIVISQFQKSKFGWHCESQSLWMVELALGDE